MNKPYSGYVEFNTNKNKAVSDKLSHYNGMNLDKKLNVHIP